MLTRLPRRRPVETLLVLPFGKPPLNLNDRLHPHAKARKVAAVREATRWTAKVARLPRDLPHVWIEFVYRAPDRRTRDADNLVATLKPVADALAGGDSRKAGYGLVADDSPRYMTKLMPVILSPDDPRLPALPQGASGVIVSWEDTTERTDR